MVTMMAGTTVPEGWLLCDGRIVSRTTYARLFAAIGTTYGAGNGSSTFALPDMTGRAPVGLDTSQTEFNAPGKTGGAKTHTLSVNEMPSHTHTQNAHTHTQNPHTHTTRVDDSVAFSAAGGNYSERAWSGGRASTSSTTATNIATTATNQNTGGGGAHNNLQPYLAINFFIAT
jgi:microcystin-dependent protein